MAVVCDLCGEAHPEGLNTWGLHPPARTEAPQWAEAHVDANGGMKWLYEERSTSVGRDVRREFVARLERFISGTDDSGATPPPPDAPAAVIRLTSGPGEESVSWGVLNSPEGARAPLRELVAYLVDQMQDQS